MIPESFLEELKYASDIEQTISPYVTLKHRGRNLLGLCPFHSEKTPSFTVYPESQSYYCFGCGNGGDAITFIRQVENLEYIEAVRFLAQKAGLTVPDDAVNDQTARLKARVLEINRESARYFHDCLLSDRGQKARVYLKDRALTSKTIRTFGVGYAPEGWNNLRDHLRGKGFKQEELLAAAVVTKGRNDSVYDMFRDRIIFPIIDLRGNVIGFGGRIMEGQGPKYLNSPDTPVFKKSRNLFALNFAKASGQDTLLLGEGYMDVIAMHQAGFTNAVATLGTSLTPEQTRLIAQYAHKVVIAYDADGAGQNAAKRAINLFGETNVSVSVLQMEGAKDPDEYIKKFGAQRFQNLIDGGKSAMHFEIDKLRAQYRLDQAEEKIAFLDAFCRLMADVNNELQREVYVGEIAAELGVGRDRLMSTIDSIRKRKYNARQKKEARGLVNSASAAAGTEERRHVANLAGAVAEEQLLTLLMLHPDVYPVIQGELSPDDFQDPGFREIFALFSRRLAENQSLELIHLSGDLPPQLMGKLAQMHLKGQELSIQPGQAEEYSKAIQSQKEKKSAKDVAAMNPDEYAAYLNSLLGRKN